MKDLARSLLSEELRSLHAARKSGILAVSRGDVTKGIFLRAGRVVFASSTLETDKLGSSLVRLGRISRAEFAAAYKVTQDGRRRLGQALIDAGLMTEEDLGRLVAHQVQKVVHSLFAWTDGEMRFREAHDPIPADLALDISTSRLLLEGARIYPDADRLEKALGRPEMRFAVHPRPSFDPTTVGLSLAEKAILNDASREFRLADMLAQSGPRPLLVRAVYALWVGGLIEPAAARAEDDEALDVVEVDTGTFRLAMTAIAEAPPDDRRSALLAQYESLARASHYEMLGVSPGATPEEIRKAYDGLVIEHERDMEELGADVRLSSILSTLKLRRREAHRILSDSRLRGQYDEQLGGLSTPKPVVVSPKAHSRAERLAREGAALIRKGERDEGVAKLLEAVNEDPKDVSCRRLLAVALSNHPTLARTAERHFLAALDMDPNDTELRYRLALYYRKAGLLARAINQLRAVLAVKPDDEVADSELKDIHRAMARLR